MIDVHSHVYFSDYDADREETIQRAFSGGMTHMISVGTEPDDWEQALSITSYDERIRAAVGIHPHWFDAHTTGDMQEELRAVMCQLESCIRLHRERVVAIGECGLDYFSRTVEPVSSVRRSFQNEGFLAQIALAGELGLPLIIHTRPSVGVMDAYVDVYEILKTRPGKFILHCYVGDMELTERFCSLPNVSFSFTGTITYPVRKVLEGTKDDPRRVVAMIPIERILTETDCPFLAPLHHRGQRNEPAFVGETMMAVAAYRGMSVEQFERQTEANAREIFSLSEGKK